MLAKWGDFFSASAKTSGIVDRVTGVQARQILNCRQDIIYEYRAVFRYGRRPLRQLEGIVVKAQHYGRCNQASPPILSRYGSIRQSNRVLEKNSIRPEQSLATAVGCLVEALAGTRVQFGKAKKGKAKIPHKKLNVGEQSLARVDGRKFNFTHNDLCPFLQRAPCTLENLQLGALGIDLEELSKKRFPPHASRRSRDPGSSCPRARFRPERTSPWHSAGRIQRLSGAGNDCSAPSRDTTLPAPRVRQVPPSR